MQFLPSGLVFATRGSRGIEIWSAATGSREHLIPLDGVGRGGVWAFEPRGDWVVFCPDDADPLILDLSGRVLLRLQLARAAAAYLRSESAEPEQGAASDDAASPEVPASHWPAYRFPAAVSLAPDGAGFAVAYACAYVLAWDLRSGRLRHCLGREGPAGRPIRIDRVVWSSDGRRLLTRDDAGWIRVWDAETGSELQRLATRERGSADGTPAPAWAWVRSGFGLTGALGITPDSTRIVGAVEECVRVWSADTGLEQGTWSGHVPMHPIYGTIADVPVIRDLRFSRDGRRAMTVGLDGTLRVWNVDTGKEIWSVRPDPCCIEFGDIAPDGRHVIWAACGGTRLYALE